MGNANQIEFGRIAIYALALLSLLASSAHGQRLAISSPTPRDCVRTKPYRRCCQRHQNERPN